MKTKRILSICALLALVAFLAGCGGGGGKKSEKPRQPSAPTTKEQVIHGDDHVSVVRVPVGGRYVTCVAYKWEGGYDTGGSVSCDWQGYHTTDRGYWRK